MSSSVSTCSSRLACDEEAPERQNDSMRLEGVEAAGRAHPVFAMRDDIVRLMVPLFASRIDFALSPNMLGGALQCWGKRVSCSGGSPTLPCTFRRRRDLRMYSETDTTLRMMNPLMASETIPCTP